MFVSGSAADGDSCVAPSAEDIHQLPGYSKQTLSDSGLTARQISLSTSNSHFCLGPDYMRLFGPNRLYIYLQLLHDLKEAYVQRSAF